LRLVLVLLPLLYLALPAEAEPIEVRAIPIALDASEPGRVAVGRLTFLAGFELRSPAARWGGLSGMAFDAEDRLIVVSDLGFWLRLELRHGADGRLTGLGAGESGPLLDEAGRAPADKVAGDAEAVALGEHELWVAFEQRHRLWRYCGDGAPAGPAAWVEGPAELSTLPANEGVEGMVRLADGRYLLAGEGAGYEGGDPRGWLGREGRWRELSFARTGDFAPTDLALLPSGDVLLLERRFTPLTGAGARLSILPAAAIRPGARLQGEEVARLQLPLAVDNLEAVAVRRHADATLVYLLSDDNRSVLQRTLLLQFRLD